jgi:hypothetical protein
LQTALEEVAQQIRQGRTDYAKMELKDAGEDQIARVIMIKTAWE